MIEYNKIGTFIESLVGDESDTSIISAILEGFVHLGGYSYDVAKKIDPIDQMNSTHGGEIVNRLMRYSKENSTKYNLVDDSSDIPSQTVDSGLSYSIYGNDRPTMAQGIDDVKLDRMRLGDNAVW